MDDTFFYVSYLFMPMIELINATQWESLNKAKQFTKLLYFRNWKYQNHS